MDAVDRVLNKRAGRVGRRYIGYYIRGVGGLVLLPPTKEKTPFAPKVKVHLYSRTYMLFFFPRVTPWTTHSNEGKSYLYRTLKIPYVSMELSWKKINMGVLTSD